MNYTLFCTRYLEHSVLLLNNAKHHPTCKHEFGQSWPIKKKTAEKKSIYFVFPFFSGVKCLTLTAKCLGYRMGDSHSKKLGVQYY